MDLFDTNLIDSSRFSFHTIMRSPLLLLLLAAVLPILTLTAGQAPTSTDCSTAGEAPFPTYCSLATHEPAVLTAASLEEAVGGDCALCSTYFPYIRDGA